MNGESYRFRESQRRLKKGWGWIVSTDKYKAFRRYIEEGMTGDWMGLLYILNQAGSVLLYNGGSLLFYN